MSRKSLIAALSLWVWGAAFTLLPSARGSAAELAPQRRTVQTKVGPAQVPYLASHDLAAPHPGLTRLLVSIHSSGFDALQYYENARLAAAKVEGASAETLIIAPQFLEVTVLPPEIPSGLLYWRVSPVRGSARCAVGPEGRETSLSAFEIMDDWLNELAASPQLPKLREIVLVGHSAGGQFVQRYAMVGKFEPPAGVRCRYVVSAPSAYAYPSAERYHSRTRRFEVPDASTRAACPDYNRWGYGLEAPYAYFADTAAEALAQRYGERFVFYLCGANDTDPNDATLGKSCGAMLQGRHRLERMQLFAEYLRHRYGPTINRRQSFAVVPNVGHHGRGTMTSPAGLKFLFAPLR